jgi:hypothetical protein
MVGTSILGSWNSHWIKSPFNHYETTRTSTVPNQATAAIASAVFSLLGLPQGQLGWSHQCYSKGLRTHQQTNSFALRNGPFWFSSWICDVPRIYNIILYTSLFTASRFQKYISIRTYRDGKETTKFAVEDEKTGEVIMIPFFRLRFLQPERVSVSTSIGFQPSSYLDIQESAKIKCIGVSIVHWIRSNQEG